MKAGHLVAELKYRAKRLCFPRPRLLAPFYYAARRAWILRTDYDLLVEGFPRSANSYAATGLWMAFPHLPKVASHSHNPVAIRRAAEHGKPAVLLVRPPAGAVASLRVFSGLPLDLLLREYILFYRLAAPYRDRCLVVRFEEVTADLPAVVHAVAARFPSLGAPQELTRILTGGHLPPHSGGTRTRGRNRCPTRSGRTRRKRRVTSSRSPAMPPGCARPRSGIGWWPSGPVTRVT